MALILKEFNEKCNPSFTGILQRNWLDFKRTYFVTTSWWLLFSFKTAYKIRIKSRYCVTCHFWLTQAKGTAEIPRKKKKKFPGRPGVKVLDTCGPETNSYLRLAPLSVFKHILQLLQWLKISETCTLFQPIKRQ